MIREVGKWNLDPIHVPAVQNIFWHGMLDNQPFSPSSHDFVHSFTNVLRGFAFIVNSKFNGSFNLLQTLTQILFPKCSRSVKNRLTIEKEKIKYFNCVYLVAEKEEQTAGRTTGTRVVLFLWLIYFIIWWNFETDSNHISLTQRCGF